MYFFPPNNYLITFLNRQLFRKTPLCPISWTSYPAPTTVCCTCSRKSARTTLCPTRPSGRSSIRPSANGLLTFDSPTTNGASPTLRRRRYFYSCVLTSQIYDSLNRREQPHISFILKFFFLRTHFRWRICSRASQTPSRRSSPISSKCTKANWVRTRKESLDRTSSSLIMPISRVVLQPVVGDAGLLLERTSRF